MKIFRALFLASLPTVSLATPAPESVKVSQATSEICRQLGEVSYWAATAEFSTDDRRRLELAERTAGVANKLRPRISNQLVREARMLGTISHGNAGLGNSNLQDARADAIGIALLVYGSCLDGKLGR